MRPVMTTWIGKEEALGRLAAWMCGSLAALPRLGRARPLAAYVCLLSTVSPPLHVREWWPFYRQEGGRYELALQVSLLRQVH